MVMLVWVYDLSLVSQPCQRYCEVTVLTLEWPFLLPVSAVNFMDGFEIIRVPQRVVRGLYCTSTVSGRAWPRRCSCGLNFWV